MTFIFQIFYWILSFGLPKMPWDNSFFPPDAPEEGVRETACPPRADRGTKAEGGFAGFCAN